MSDAAITLATASPDQLRDALRGAQVIAAAAAAEIQRLLRENGELRRSRVEWRATAQQLPDDDTTVLIAWRDGDVSVGWHDGDAGWRGIDSMPCEAPAHWADLPEAPR